MKKIVLAIFTFLLISNLGLSQDAKIIKIEKSNLTVEINKEADPDVYIDGKKYDSAIIDLLDPDKIASVNVYKNEEAIKKYNAPNGVIVVTTKQASKKISDKDGFKTEFKIKSNGSNEPLIIIDGKEVKKSRLNKLDPDDIKTINVYKGEEALRKYKAPNGVIVVITKSNK